MNSHEPYVSVIEPVSPAIERVKTVLFRPFDLGRWFVIGFCAWLADLTRGGGGGGGHPTGLGNIGGGRHELADFIAQNPWVIGVALATFIFVIVIGLLVTWLSSRGRFMFLHCVAQNVAEVKRPWHLFRGYANSLFLFRVVLGVLWALAALAFIIPAAVTVIGTGFVLRSTVLSVLGIVAFALSFIAVMTVFAIIASFTEDFVVPIMYLNGLSCRQGWAALLDLLAVNKMRFFLYLLFKIVISMTVAAIVIGLILITCGCACCFFALPFIGTVAFLPIIVFRRAYSLYYLAQYGPDLNVFAPDTSDSPNTPQVT